MNAFDCYEILREQYRLLQANNNDSFNSQSLRIKTIIIVSLFERSFFGSVMVNFSLEFFIISDYVFSFDLLFLLFKFRFRFETKLFFAIALFMIIKTDRKNKIMNKSKKSSIGWRTLTFHIHNDFMCTNRIDHRYDYHKKKNELSLHKTHVSSTKAIKMIG